MSAETLSIHNTIPPTRRASKRFSFMNFSTPLDAKINSSIDSELSVLKNDINTSDKKQKTISRKSSTFSILSFKSNKAAQSAVDLTHTPETDHSKLQSNSETPSPSTTPSLSSASSESLPSSKSSSSSEINQNIPISPTQTHKPAKQPSKFKQVLAKFFKPKQQGSFSPSQLQRKTYTSTSVSRSKADFAKLYMDDDGTLDSADIDFNLATVEDFESAFNGYSYAAAPMRGTYHSSLKKLSDSPNRNLRQIVQIQSILKRLKSHPLNGTAFNFSSLPGDSVTPPNRDPDGPIIPRQVRVMMVPQRRASVGSSSTGFGQRSRASITRTYSNASSTPRKAGPGIVLQSKDSMKSWESINSPIF
ncbi:hypothetical protein CONCODRAFT_71311 [Conidiobolus coronatus NRRL 28638]|uniref:Uncharacterized protein n=1 Tax=Conidiobolus coronatus (strain ATCC 28846 / CBS 209.66 / NRRL 28638) TaxID=796925 RepID=A0A137P404_CONC2|nr:hypothetical protein CONCODRAFT_71311 [Conidiobolus coronatus NRRL 28638]|eukprot:KXN69669.1 hypothetical protein CONCODRAFT_71311 [Conidiobolus coronatus NRRL 28638]